MNGKTHIGFEEDFLMLKAEIDSTWIDGCWKDIPYGHEFRTEDGGVMAFYPRRGNFLFQGEVLACLELQRAVEAHAEKALSGKDHRGWRFQYDKMG